MNQTFADQLQEAADINRNHSKHWLIGQLLESNRIIKADAEQILKLGEHVRFLERTLQEIIVLENCLDVRSYGFGDIAREALKKDF